MVVLDPWLDDLTKPGTVQAHDVGTWLTLRVDVYRRLRQADVEAVARELVRVRHWSGAEYLHAVGCGGYLIHGVEGVPGRVNVESLRYTDRLKRPPPPPRPPRVVMPAGTNVVRRRGCGCGGHAA